MGGLCTVKSFDVHEKRRNYVDTLNIAVEEEQSLVIFSSLETNSIISMHFQVFFVCSRVCGQKVCIVKYPDSFSE